MIKTGDFSPAPALCGIAGDLGIYHCLLRNTSLILRVSMLRFCCNGTGLTSKPNRPPAPDSLIRSEQPEVAESLFNGCDLVRWTGILWGSVPWCGEAKLLFAARNPGALGHKAVLAHNPFLDFLVRGAWTKRLLLPRLTRVLPRLTRAPVSSFVVSTSHAGFGLPSI
jgi:hypothetical protein